MISAALTLCSLGIVGWVIYNFVSQYRLATGTVWQRIVLAEKGSQAILLQKLGIVAGALTIGADNVVNVIANLLNDPDFATQAKAFIQANLTATAAGIGLVAFCALTIWARLRPKV